MIPGSARSLEEEKATDFSIPVWEIPWTEEPGGLKAMGSKKVGYNLVTEQAGKPRVDLIFDYEP